MRCMPDFRVNLTVYSRFAASHAARATTALFAVATVSNFLVSENQASM